MITHFPAIMGGIVLVCLVIIIILMVVQDGNE